MIADEPLIRKTPGVMGGEACIRRTRISVWILVGYRKLGISDDELLVDYPGLSQIDLDAAWEYYRDHHDEIENAIRANEED